MSFITKAIGWLTGGWIGPLVGVVALLGSLWAGYAYIVHSARSEGRAEVQAAWDADKQARALLAAAAEENKRVKEAQHAIDLANEREQRKRDTVVIDTVRTATAGTFNGLRDTSAAVATGIVQACQADAAGRGVDGLAEASRGVFDECAGRREEVAGEAEELAQRLRGLQAWAGSALAVCGQ